MRRPPAPWYAGPPQNGFSSTGRPSEVALFSGLRIRTSDLTLFQQTFAESKRVYGYASRGAGGWRTERKHLDTRVLLRHLAGYRSVALRWSESVDALLLDFDSNPEESLSATYGRAQTVLRRIPGEWYVYRSSDSDGLHAVCFIESPVPLVGARSWLSAKLTEAGFPHQPGVVESRMGNAHTRLPFGMGSLPVDPITFEPLYWLPLSDAIEHAAEHRRNFLLPSELITDWCRTHQGLGGGSSYYATIERLQRDGLFPEISTFKALWKLNWFLQARDGRTQDQAATWLKDWIRSKHNGLSQRIRSRRIHEVYQQIDQIVWRFEPEIGKRLATRFGRWNSPVGLCAEELRRLLRYHLDFPTLKKTYLLLAHCKANMRSSGNKHPYHNVPRKCHAKAHLTYVARETRELRDVYVPLPWTLLRRLGIRDPETILPRLTESGILELKRREHADTKRCREYWVRFALGCDGGKPLESLEAGLREVLGRKGLVREFGRSYARRIESSKNVTNGADVSCVLPVSLNKGSDDDARIED